MTARRFLGLPTACVLALAASACGGDDGGTTADAATTATAEADTTTTTEATGTGSDATGTDTAAATTTPASLACTPEELPLTEPGTLTVATGEPVFEPWMVDDDPSNGEGFESALVYALAEELGFDAEDVAWVRTGFDEAIAPGSKDYDFNVQQYSITDDRDEVVDFSRGYYTVEQALVGAADSPVADASSLADLQSARLGAAIGTTSLDYIEDVINPEDLPQVFDDNAAAKAAFDAGQVDGLVFDLPTAYYITAVEIPDAEIVGVLPRIADNPEQLGFLFEEGSELVPCIDEGLAALEQAGTIADLEEEWLNRGGDIPTLSE